MSETKLPWPGYRLRPGWRMLEFGEVIEGGDFVTLVRPPNFEWRPTVSPGCINTDSYARFRRTDPNATLPPVEPIPAEPVQAEPGDDVRKALEIVGDTIADLRRERDELRKQVETLTTACEGLSLEKARLENELHRMQSTQFKTKRLEWTNGDYICCWKAGQYRIAANNDGLFHYGSYGEFLGKSETLAQAKAACQRHADEQKRPTVEQAKAETPDPGEGWRLVDKAVDKPGPGIEWWDGEAGKWMPRKLQHEDFTFGPSIYYRIRTTPETPAVEIHWPEGAVLLAKDCAGLFFHVNDGEWKWIEYTGPDPFPPGQDRRKCYLINPACR